MATKKPDLDTLLDKKVNLDNSLDASISELTPKTAETIDIEEKAPQTIEPSVEEGIIEQEAIEEEGAYEVAKLPIDEILSKKNKIKDVKPDPDYKPDPGTDVDSDRVRTYSEIAEDLNTKKEVDDIISMDADGNFVFKMASEEEVQHIEKMFGFLEKNELAKASGSINNFLRGTGDELFDVADYSDVFNVGKAKKSLTINELEEMAAEVGASDLYFKIRDVRENGGSLNQAETVRGMWETFMLQQKALTYRKKIVAGEATEIDEENYRRIITQRDFVYDTVTEQVGDAARITRYQAERPELSVVIKDENAKYLKALKEELDRGDITLREYAMFEDDLLPFQRMQFKKDVKEHLAKPKNERTKFSFRHMVTELYINSKLSAPLTHLANIAGNASWNLYRNVEYLAFAGLEKGTQVGYKALGIDYEVSAHFNESWSAFSQVISGGGDGLMAMAKAIRKGGPVTDGVGKEDLARMKTINRDLLGGYKDTMMGDMVEYFGYATRLPTTLLTAEDEFFKAVVGKMELSRIARQKYNKAIADGYTQEEAATMYARTMSNPTDEVKKKVRELAREGTFTRDLPPGFFKRAQGFMNSPEMKMFVPFYKTLVNISLEVAGRIPGLHMLEPRTRAILKGNDPVAKKMVRAKLMMGTVLMGSVAKFTLGVEQEDANFFITGAAPTTKEARDAFRRKNFREYSIMVKQQDGSYKAYEYSRLDPFGQIMAMAADLSYTLSRPGIDSTSEYAQEAAMGFLNATLRFIEDQPLTDGFDLLSKLGDLRGGDASDWFNKNGGEIIEKMTDFYVGTFINPMSALNNQLNVVEGQTPRDYGVRSDQRGADWIRTSPASGVIEGFYKALNRAKSNSIFFNEEAPPKLTLFGTTMPAPELGIFSFSRSYQEQNSTVDDAMIKNDFYYAMPKDVKDGYRLTVDEYNRVLTEMNSFTKRSEYGRGETTLLEELELLVQDPDWIALSEGKASTTESPTEQRERAHSVMGSIIKAYEALAWEAYDARFPDRANVKDRINQEKKFNPENIRAYAN